jgi:CheY-like chemotaxis protein
MDGITLVQQIRSLATPIAGVPVIAASGNADDQMRGEAIAAGCDLFLTKPFDLMVLCREIASLIKARRQAAPARGETPSAMPSLNRIELRLREAT